MSSAELGHEKRDSWGPLLQTELAVLLLLPLIYSCSLSLCRHLTQRWEPTYRRRPPSSGQLTIWSWAQTSGYHLQHQRGCYVVLVARALWDTTIGRAMVTTFMVLSPGLEGPQYVSLLGLRRYSFLCSPPLLQLHRLTSTGLGPCFRHSESISCVTLMSIFWHTSVQPTINTQCARICAPQEEEVVSSPGFVEQGGAQECGALDSESRSVDIVDIQGESHGRTWSFRFQRGSRQGQSHSASHNVSSPARAHKNAFVRALRMLCCCLCTTAENE